MQLFSDDVITSSVPTSNVWNKNKSQTLLQLSLSLSALVVLENTFGLGHFDHHSDEVIFIMSSVKCEISPQVPFFVEKKASSPLTGIASIWV